MGKIKSKEKVLELGFFNERRWLSNMWRVPIVYAGHTWPAVENLYQAHKTKNKELKLTFIHCTPEQSKKQGRDLLDVRTDWNEVKVLYMHTFVRLKFAQHPDLAEKLIQEKPPIIEHNYWNDRFWGKHYGEGTNMLGKILMLVRSELITMRTLQKELD